LGGLALLALIIGLIFKLRRNRSHLMQEISQFPAPRPETSMFNNLPLTAPSKNALKRQSCRPGNQNTESTNGINDEGHQSQLSQPLADTNRYQVASSSDVTALARIDEVTRRELETLRIQLRQLEVRQQSMAFAYADVTAANEPPPGYF
jgi:hypothetical protein